MHLRTRWWMHCRAEFSNCPIENRKCHFHACTAQCNWTMLKDRCYSQSQAYDCLRVEPDRKWCYIILHITLKLEQDFVKTLLENLYYWLFWVTGWGLLNCTFVIIFLSSFLICRPETVSPSGIQTRDFQRYSFHLTSRELAGLVKRI